MTDKPKKGDKIIVVEGPLIGEEGIVTKVAKKYDEYDRKYRWMAWLETSGSKTIKTRLNWVREL